MLAEGFDWLTAEDVAPYLVQMPGEMPVAPEERDRPYLEEFGRLDVPVRPGDEFTRFGECAVPGFLRLLRVNVVLSSGRVRFPAAEFRRLWVPVRRWR